MSPGGLASLSGQLPAAAVLAAPFVGSFIGLCADRWPRGRTVVRGRSECDGCERALAAWDLAPILSYLALRGRARCCGARLRPTLPAVELSALALALWAVWAMEGALAPVTAALGWVLLALALIDARCWRLPDALTLPLLLAGLGLSALGATGPLALHAAGAALGWGAMAAVAALYRRLRGVEGLGMGDAKLLGAAGAWVGPFALPTVMLWACAAGLIWAAVEAVRRGGIGWRSAIPFGPALALGLWLTWLYGPLAPGVPT